MAESNETVALNKEEKWHASTDLFIHPIHSQSGAARKPV